MKISIITVCFNSSKTIKKTFESIKNQTYDNIEYIVVDGASSDDTLKIIKNYNSCISNYISESDKGLYDAMNKGIALATGDIIGILNSDDIFSDMFVLENIAKFHQENDIDASIGNITQFNESGRTVRKYSSKSWTPENLKIGFMPPHPSIFFKKDLFENYGKYRLDFISGADYELIIRFFLT
ncbi:glycosyltransferase, partial [Flavobacteriaceae bacterium]|nr:glycosyltransferase [Flavobacteriaceae bacterium]